MNERFKGGFAGFLACAIRASVAGASLAANIKDRSCKVAIATSADAAQDDGAVKFIERDCR